MIERGGKVLILSHISDLSGPTEALEDFLVKKKVQTLFTIYNPLEYCRLSRRVIKLYNYGKLERKTYPINIKYGRLFTWFLDCLLTIYHSLMSKNKYEIAVCFDSLNTLMGLLLKIIYRCETVICYFPDWTPIRFKNKLLNTIYQKINNYSARSADYVWCTSKRLVDLQVRKGVPRHKTRYVPDGVPEYSYGTLIENIDYKTLLFLGALERTKGINLVIDAWPDLFKKDPYLKLVVIGKTPGNSDYYERILKSLPNVQILGVLPHGKVLETIVKFGIGLAPYSPDNDSVSFYGDPCRIKDYLVCGLPVIVTPVPEIAYEIGEVSAGMVIKYSKESLINGVITLTKDKDINYFYRKNAIALANRYKWDSIFSNALGLDKDSNDENSACVS